MCGWWYARCSDDVAPAKLGKGIAITIFDAGMIPNTALRDFAKEVAEELKLPTQISISEGGATDGGRIHLHDTGVLTLTFSIPTRIYIVINPLFIWMIIKVLFS